jgi:hypothetical protein
MAHFLYVISQGEHSRSPGPETQWRPAIREKTEDAGYIMFWA